MHWGRVIGLSSRFPFRIRQRLVWWLVNLRLELVRVGLVRGSILNPTLTLTLALALALRQSSREPEQRRAPSHCGEGVLRATHLRPTSSQAVRRVSTVSLVGMTRHMVSKGTVRWVHSHQSRVLCLPLQPMQPMALTLAPAVYAAYSPDPSPCSLARTAL